MNNKQKNKLYLKASELYQKGEIDKALVICEKGMSEDLKNSAIINLKGLLLYIKGDLEGAVTAWKINSDYNDDQMAKSYIADSKSDRNRLNGYSKAIRFLNDIKIDEAILELKECNKSDFNSINVNIALASCYMKKGEYTTSSIYITKALSIDKNNKQAENLAKNLNEFAGIKLEVNNRRISKGILAGVSVVILIILSISIYKFIGFNMQKNNNDKSDKPLETSDILSNDNIENGETKEENLVNIEELNVLIKNKEYKDIHKLISNLDVAKLESKEKSTYLKGKEILEKEGVNELYKTGMELYDKNKLQDAKSDLLIAYTYGKDSYLYPHILFFRAAIEEKLNNTNDAIKLYEEYYKNNKEGDYSEESLYKLVLLYKDSDIDKSVSFAKEIRNKYPKSIYNNATISNLLDNKK